MKARQYVDGSVLIVSDNAEPIGGDPVLPSKFEHTHESEPVKTTMAERVQTRNRPRKARKE